MHKHLSYHYLYYFILRSSEFKKQQIKDILVGGYMFRKKTRLYLIHIISMNVCLLAASYLRNFSMLLVGILLVIASISLTWLLYNSVDRR